MRTVSEDLEKSRASDVNNGEFLSGSVGEGLLGNEGKELVDIDGGLVVLVLLVVEVAHTNLTKVTRVARGKFSSKKKGERRNKRSDGSTICQS